ncbi:MAG TPA: aminotransferase class IV [Candidatus Krumholzibacteria bacterium]|nr:aminotransferase class IV [Candidatus Krumholzibacteria bacterium]
MKVHLNGELIAADEARVSPFDAGYLYGDGLFDTLRSYRGFLYLLAEHVQRLAREAELLQIPFDPSPGTWDHLIGEVLQANDLKDTDARVRIQISRGGGPHTDQVSVDPEQMQPVVFIVATEVSKEVSSLQERGARILSMQSAFARGNFPQIKSLNYLPSIMALRFARARGFDEACLLNRQNKVLECATSNIFLLKGKVLRTPSRRLGILPGITRGRILQLAAQEGLKVEEAASELRDLVTADEVFLTGSVKEITPVVGLDEGPVTRGKAGEWTRRLQKAYREDIELTRGAQAAG